MDVTVKCFGMQDRKKFGLALWIGVAQFGQACSNLGKYLWHVDRLKVKVLFLLDVVMYRTKLVQEGG